VFPGKIGYFEWLMSGLGQDYGEPGNVCFLG